MLNRSIAQFSGVVYPDNSFTCGRVPRAKKRAAEAQYERAFRQQEPINPLDTLDWLLGSATIEGKFQSITESPNKIVSKLVRTPDFDDIKRILSEVTIDNLYLFAKYYNEEVDLSQPLFIVSHELSQKKKRDYGKRGITRYGKRLVRNACIVLEKRYGKKRLGFITCTLPTFSRQAHDALNRDWGEVTRRFYQKLRRKAKRCDREFIYVGVTEMQEKRYKKYGIACPHLHFVYVCRDSPSSSYLFDITEMHNAWNDSLYEVLNKNGVSVCMDANRITGNINGQIIRKSAAGYLGKYLSKGGAILEVMLKEGVNKLPKQWWTASAYVKKLYHESIACMQSELAKKIFYNLEVLVEKGLIKSLHFVYVCIGGEDRCVGISGIFHPKIYPLVLRGKSIWE